MNKEKIDKHHIHMVSDSTGETLNTITKAVLVQYKQIDFIQHMHPLVRNIKQLKHVHKIIRDNPGMVLFTLYDKEIRDSLSVFCNKIKVPLIDPLDPIHQSLSAFYSLKGNPVIGGQHQLNSEYFDRIDAMNYTIANDDGAISSDLNLADIVLVGVSRTSKTPTSIYLANRGIKTANIPFIDGIPLPNELSTISKPLIVGLIATPERVIQIRKNRIVALNANQETNYVDKRHVTNEIVMAMKLFESKKWPIIDVTRKSIEETAAEIMALRRKRDNANK